MIMLIFGSRSLTGEKVYKIMSQVIKSTGVKPTKIISGGAAGVDSLAKIYAQNWKIPFQGFPADWKTFGKGAGYVRNKEMVEMADIAVGIWDGKSKGSNHTRNLALQKGIPLIIETIHVAEPVKSKTARPKGIQNALYEDD